jgi:hypothetical protein
MRGEGGRGETAQKQDHDRISDARNAKKHFSILNVSHCKNKTDFTWQKLPSDILQTFSCCALEDM